MEGSDLKILVLKSTSEQLVRFVIEHNIKVK